MKVQENQIAKIVSLAGEGRIPEFMDLIKTIIVVNGIVMKKNQLTSTKKIMQSYKTSAYVFTLPPEERYSNNLFTAEVFSFKPVRDLQNPKTSAPWQ